MSTRWFVLALALGLLGCRGGKAEVVAMTATCSAPASDGRLEIRLEIDRQVVMDRVPERTARLRFRNLTAEPLRIYMPPEPFRATISTLFFTPREGRPLFEPEPRPHGVVIGEEDFPLLGPGQSREFTQTFTLDPFQPGGPGTARRPGFEAGKSVEIRWIYKNRIRQWKGGAQTLDGPTKTLFGGGDIPHIWLGELTVTWTWTVPD